MNLNAEQLRIIRRLRELSRSWMISLRDTVRTFSAISPTHPNYPLPSDFPYTNTAIQEKIRWVEEVEEGKRYSFNVCLEYHLDTSSDWSPALWVLRSGPTFLGVVEIDYRILHDKDPVIIIGTDFVLEMMILSLQHENHLRLSSRVIPNTNPVIYPGLRGNIEIFEFRTFDGILVSEASRRMVDLRNCSTCDCPLPPAGPDVCIIHLLNNST